MNPLVLVLMVVLAGLAGASFASAVWVWHVRRVARLARASGWESGRLHGLAAGARAIELHRTQAHRRGWLEGMAAARERPTLTVVGRN